MLEVVSTLTPSCVSGNGTPFHANCNILPVLWCTFFPVKIFRVRKDVLNLTWFQMLYSDKQMSNMIVRSIYMILSGLNLCRSWRHVWDKIENQSMNEPFRKSKIKKRILGKMIMLWFSVLIFQLLPVLLKGCCYGLHISHPPENPN